MEPTKQTEALDIQVKGVVQGVGFRPFVYRCAQQFGLTGWVLNALDGVMIHVEGSQEALDLFVIKLSQDAPEAAHVKEIELHEAPPEGFDSFKIRFSDVQETERTTLVSPDLATCDACVAELFDPENRRYHYPFINCTNCGPRFTIIDELPYDRPNTSMKEFTMCEPCQTEYDDPADRRFHAQPNACFNCGPRLGWIDVEGMLPSEVERLVLDDLDWAFTQEDSDSFVEDCVQMLKHGKIVAVKGLGGYHLVCDAQNPTALATLRERKRRFGKAFAVMAASVDAARAYVEIDEAEVAQLESSARPIVLLRKRAEADLAMGLADDLPELGIMLPATPLQHLISRAFDGLLVMTSGNVHDDPIVIEEHEAFEKLAGIADAFLVNNRTIVERFDDSVLRVLHPLGSDAVVQVIRRARGMAPAPLALPALEDVTSQTPDQQSAGDAPASTVQSADAAPQVFAVGSELKNTFTMTRDDEAFVSQHLGDMEHIASFDAWLEATVLYERLFHLEPTLLACDLHPEYVLSKWARAQEKPLVEVQHHHAHVVAAMAENALVGPVCGIAFDGTGYGVDGAIWGGEVLLSNLRDFERFANVAYFPLPGGVQAIHHTDRCAYGVLWSAGLLDHPAARAFFADRAHETVLMNKMIEGGLNTPFTSSMGRLFDAASALLDVCSEPRYEGEGAILFEAEIAKGFGPNAAQQMSAVRAVKASSDAPAVAADALEASSNDLAAELRALERYQFGLLKNTATEQSTAQDTSVLLLDPAPVFEALLDDLAAHVAKPLIARRFHEAVVSAIVTLAETVRALYDIDTVTLSGGVFMNRYLIERTLHDLQEDGFTIALNRDLPPNDASVSYGQAVIGLHSNEGGR